MANTVGQFQQAAFTSPAFGDSPISSSVVRGNDNSVATNHNGHDADYTIHVQQSTAASRPAAGVAGRIWFTSDTFELAYDTGAAWSSVKVSAANVNAGTFGAGTFTFTGDLVVSGNLSGSGTLTISGATQFNGTVTFGDATSDTVVFTGRVASDVLPSTANARSLGSVALPYASVWAQTGFSTTNGASELLRVAAAPVAGSFPVVSGNGSGEDILFSYNAITRFGFYDLNSAPAFAPAFDNQGALGTASFRFNALRVGTGASQVDGALTVGGAVEVNNSFRVGAGGGTVSYGGSPYRAAILSSGLNAIAYGLAIVDGASATGGAFLGFVSETNTLIGSVVRNAAASVQYNTTSDARLKTDIAPAPAPGDLLDRVAVRSYRWRGSGQVVTRGFVAQELHAVVPEAVTVGGEDPAAKPWQVELAALVPLLVQEVQALRRRVDTLEALVVP